MKPTATLSLIFVLTASSLAFAQSGGMKDMDMHKGMNMQKCSDMKGMNGMDMKGMDMQKCQNMMNSQDKNPTAKQPKAVTHQATGVVKAVDAAHGTVTLAHGPVKSLNWSAMTMGFSVKDKALFDKLAVGKKVQVDFVQQEANYVVTAVK
ncbi:MAG: copper-binding protein [Proteobacteria bacterium]|nr:copper-binding protein [Pseudomonadota bacterium]